MKRYISILLLVFIFILCTSSTISFNVMVPAPIGLPQNIKTIALVDRTVPENKKTNIIEGVLTGEGAGQDKDAAQIAIDGAFSVMQNTQRFQVIRTTERLKGSDIGKNFPDPLPWTTIIALCKKYNVDAIISLESFDSDFIVTSALKPGSVSGGDGKSIPIPVPTAKGVATVNLGFRIYDPYSKSIIDEYRFSHHKDWESQGNSLEGVVKTLIGKNEAVKEVSYNSGVIYAKRITPGWYRVSRTYYRKCKHNRDLAEGARMMEINDWPNAISALEKAIQNGKRKVKGRASHNLAVVYEILGNFDNAKKYAQDAYARYRNKPSKDYLYDLNRRIRAQEVLDQQMNQ